MHKVLVGLLFGVALIASGCQSAPPRYQHSCYNYRAIEAGLCDDRDAGRLFGGVVGGGFRSDY